MTSHISHHSYTKPATLQKHLHVVALQVLGDRLACEEADIDDGYRPPPPPNSAYFTLPYKDHTYVLPSQLSPTAGSVPPVTLTIPPLALPHTSLTPPPVTQTPVPTTVAAASAVLNGHINVDDVSASPVLGSSNNVGSSVETSPVKDGDDSLTRCICDFTHDDGYMICCDRCGVWQHVDCMGVDRNDIPDMYYCERCNPRKLNKHRAVQLQTKKREQLNIDTSETESENETKQTEQKPQPKRLKTARKNGLNITTSKAKTNEGGKKKKQTKNGWKFQKKSNGLNSSKSHASKKKSQLSNSENLPPMNTVNDWTSNSTTFADTYEEADGNLYSAEVREIISKMKHSNHSILHKPPIQLRAQLCKVSPFGNNAKGLEATEDLSPNEPLIEFKGKIMSKRQFSEELLHLNGTRHVLYYNNVDNTELVVNAATYGNDARHVRRSCRPNAEVRHFFDGSLLYFYLYSTQSIRIGNEITIPFDFVHEIGTMSRDCACGDLTSCKWRSLSATTVTSASVTSLKIPTKAARKQKQSVKEDLLIVKDELDVTPQATPSPTKPDTPTKVPAKKLRRLSSAMSVDSRADKSVPNTPLKEDPFISVDDSRDCSRRVSFSEKENSCDEQSGGHKLSREERKMQAIVKAIQRMEQQEERRKEAKSRNDSSSRRSSARDSDGEKKPKKTAEKMDTEDPEDTAEASQPEENIKLPALKKGKKKLRVDIKSAKKSARLMAQEDIVKAEESSDGSVDPLGNLTDESEPKQQVGKNLPDDDIDQKVQPLTNRKKPCSPVKRQTYMTSIGSSLGESMEDSADECSACSSAATTPNPAPDKLGFKLPPHATKKQKMLNDRFQDKAVEALTFASPSSSSTSVGSPTAAPSPTQQLEINVGGLVEQDFMECLPSPQGGGVAISRNKRFKSFSGGRAVNSLQTNVYDALKSLPKKAAATPVAKVVQVVTPAPASMPAPLPPPPAVVKSQQIPETPPPQTLSTSSNRVNTKKRWLWQVMNDNPDQDDISEGVGPTLSSAEFVTPLKKRRFARESLSTETLSSSISNTPCTTPADVTFYIDQPSLSYKVDAESSLAAAADRGTNIGHSSGQKVCEAAGLDRNDSIKDQGPVWHESRNMSEEPVHSICHDEPIQQDEDLEFRMARNYADEEALPKERRGNVTSEDDDRATGAQELLTRYLTSQSFDDSVKCQEGVSSSTLCRLQSGCITGSPASCSPSQSAPQACMGSLSTRQLVDFSPDSTAFDRGKLSGSTPRSSSNDSGVDHGPGQMPSDHPINSFSFEDDENLDRPCSSSVVKTSHEHGSLDQDDQVTSVAACSLDRSDRSTDSALHLSQNSEVERCEEDVEEGEVQGEEEEASCSLEKEEGELSDGDEDAESHVEVPADSSETLEHNSPQPDLCNEADHTEKPEEEELPSAYRSHLSNNSEVSSSKSSFSFRDSPLFRKHSKYRLTNGHSPSKASSCEGSPVIDQECSHSSSSVNGHCLQKQVSSPVVSCSDGIAGTSAAKQITVDNSIDSASSVSSEDVCKSPSTGPPAQGKKKVSLLEYRKRMGQRTQVSSADSSAQRFTSVTLPTTNKLPTLPLASYTTSKSSEDAVVEKPVVDYHRSNSNAEVTTWSAQATAAERIREQTHMSLTERLRREFGLDTLVDDESDSVNGGESADSPPPPPPPPPPKHSISPATAVAAFVSLPAVLPPSTQQSVFIGSGPTQLVGMLQGLPTTLNSHGRSKGSTPIIPGKFRHRPNSPLLPTPPYVGQPHGGLGFGVFPNGGGGDCTQLDLAQRTTLSSHPIPSSNLVPTVHDSVSGRYVVEQSKRQGDIGQRVPSLLDINSMSANNIKSAIFWSQDDSR